VANIWFGKTEEKSANILTMTFAFCYLFYGGEQRHLPSVEDSVVVPLLIPELPVVPETGNRKWSICSFLYLIFVVLQCSATTVTVLNQSNHIYFKATRELINHFTSKLWISKNNKKNFVISQK
jgi:hypothetical protein